MDGLWKSCETTINAGTAEHAEQIRSAGSASSAVIVDRYSDESSSVGQTDLRQVQGGTPARRRANHLFESET